MHTNGATYLEVKAELVDGDGVLAGIVLHDTCEERLREVEPRHPEDVWFAVVIPFLSTENISTRVLLDQLTCKLL